MMDTPIDPSIAVDARGLGALKNIRPQDQDNYRAAIEETAGQFEALFTQMLLKSMREANDAMSSDLFSSNETEFYESMYDKEVSMQLTKTGGLGLQSLIADQLLAAQGLEPKR